jgi:hypothetical protein
LTRFHDFWLFGQNWRRGIGLAVSRPVHVDSVSQLLSEAIVIRGNDGSQIAVRRSRRPFRRASAELRASSRLVPAHLGEVEDAHAL